MGEMRQKHSCICRQPLHELSDFLFVSLSFDGEWKTKWKD